MFTIINGISKIDAVNVLKNADFTEERGILKKIRKIITTYKMSKEIITFGNIEVEKYRFHQHKSPISTYDVNIDRIGVTNEVPLSKKGFKYSTGYENDQEKVMSLCIMKEDLKGNEEDCN